MVAQRSGPVWTVEGYLDLERHSPVRHEYHRGQVVAMAGGSQAHSQIAGNVYAVLRAAVRGGPCRALNPDIKVRQSSEDYVYADAVVTCDPRDRDPGLDWVAYPTLVVEVLSPSTERYDRGEKFAGYAAIATLQEYLLVAQDRRTVEVRRRGEDGTWTVATYGPREDVPLESLGITLSADSIYEDSGI